MSPRLRSWVCSWLHHRPGWDWRGKPVCTRCGERLRFATPDEHAHSLRYGIRPR